MLLVQSQQLERKLLAQLKAHHDYSPLECLCAYAQIDIHTHGLEKLRILVRMILVRILPIDKR